MERERERSGFGKIHGIVRHFKVVCVRNFGKYTILLRAEVFFTCRLGNI